MELINSIYNFGMNFILTLLLPFNIVLKILKMLYNTIFTLQIYMSSTCSSLFGEGFGCKVIHPSYIFSQILKDLIIWSIIVYIAIKLWNMKKNKNII